MCCLSDDKMYIIPSPCAHMDPDVFITLAKETTSSLAVLGTIGLEAKCEHAYI